MFFSGAKQVKRYRFGRVLHLDGRYYFQLTLRFDDYGEIFVWEALRLWRDRLAAMDPPGQVLDLDVERTPVAPGLTVVAAPERLPRTWLTREGQAEEGRLLEWFQQAYAGFFSALLDSRLTDPEFTLRLAAQGHTLPQAARAGLSQDSWMGPEARTFH